MDIWMIHDLLRGIVTYGMVTWCEMWVDDKWDSVASYDRFNVFVVFAVLLHA